MIFFCLFVASHPNEEVVCLSPSFLDVIFEYHDGLVESYLVLVDLLKLRGHVRPFLCLLLEVLWVNEAYCLILAAQNVLTIKHELCDKICDLP
jgi:hypothetical protein